MTRRPFWPWFFLVATLVSFFWPGWAAESADFARVAFNALAGREALTAWQPIALAMMVSIWAALALSRIVYNALETFEIALVLTLFPLLFLALFAAGVLPRDVVLLAQGRHRSGRCPRGSVGRPVPHAPDRGRLRGVRGYAPPRAVALGPGQGIRDERVPGRIAGIRGKNEPLEERGFAFSADRAGSVARFRGWMGLAEKELFWTFAVLILLSVVITTLLVAATIGTGRDDLAGNLTAMVLLQAAHLRAEGGAWIEIAFLMGGALVLFSTQVGIVDTVTRIAGDIFYDRIGRRTRTFTLKRTFLGFLTLFVAASVGVILLRGSAART